MAKNNKIVESILAKEKAKGVANPEDIKSTQGMSIAEKIDAKRQGSQQQLAKSAEESDADPTLGLKIGGIATRAGMGAHSLNMRSAYNRESALDGIEATDAASQSVVNMANAARMRGYMKAEQKRLKPLYDYLESEGDAGEGIKPIDFTQNTLGKSVEEMMPKSRQYIPRGKALLNIMDKNSGVTDKSAMYNNTDRLRAMYMLSPELAKDSQHVEWNEHYPAPTTPIMTPSEDGLYHIGENTYTHEDMVNALSGYMPVAQHNRLLKYNKHYRDDYARSLGYKSWDDAWETPLKNLTQELEVINEELASETYDKMVSASAFETAPATEGTAFGAYIADMMRGGLSTQQELEKAKALTADDFISGFDEGFNTVEVMSLGYAGIGASVNLYNILEKVNNGQALSEREEKVYRAYEIGQELEQLHSEFRGGKMSRGRRWGQGVGTSTEAMAQFAASMAATGGIGSGIAAANTGIKQAFKQGLKSGLKQTVKMGSKKAGVYGARSAVAASFSPMTYSTFADRRVGQYHIDESGNLVKETRPWAKDLGIAYVETFNEYFSEYFGDGMGKLIDVSPSKIGRMFGLDKWAGKKGYGNIGDYLDATFVPTKRMREAMHHVDFAGFVWEAPSEAFGDFMNSLMLAPFSEEHGFEQFATKEYWEDLYGTTAIFGGSLSVLGAPATIKNMYNTSKNVKRREAALEKIQDVELRNNLKSVMSLDSMEEMSQAMVDLHIEKLSPDQAAAAVEYLTSATMVKVLTGADMEDTRLLALDDYVKNANNIVYKGKDGSLPSDEIIQVVDKNGRELYVEAGDVNNTSDVSMLKCKTYDAENRKWVDVAVPASEVANITRESVEQVISAEYERMFGTEIMAERLKEIEGARKSMENPSAEVVRGHYLRNGLKMYDTGAEVSLADGRTAVVESMLADGSYLVRSVNPATQKEELYEVPFMQVLQPEASLAEAQKQMFAKNIESATQSIERAEVTEESAAEGMATEEDVDAQMEDIVEQAQEMPKPVPTREDGSVDFSAIDDSKMFATEYAKKMGSEDKAKASVVKMAANARAEASQLREKSDKMTDPNEVVDAVAKADAMDAKADFYDKVLAEYAPQEEAQTETYKAGDVVEYDGRIAEVVGEENEGVVIADAQGRMTVVDPTTLSRVAEAPAEENAVNPIEDADDKLIEEAEAGIVQNVFGKMLDARTANVIDAMAKALGVKVVFVENVTTQAGTRANADIKGNVVRIAWAQRRKAISFLAGHEFTHRMKDMSPEAYAEFTKSVKEYLGEAEWQRRMNAQRATYESHNRRAKAEGKPLLSYEDALLEEEVVADFVGDMVESRHAFEHYVQKQSQKPSLLQAIKKVFSAIGSFFRRMGARTEAQRMKEMIAHLDTFINKAREDAKKNGMQGSVRPRNSLIGEVGASALDMAEEATTRLDNLAVAREMEASGKDAKAIRMATGWERGADGLWRYEIMDAEVNLYDGDENAIRKKIEVAEEEEKDFMQQSKADTKELRERTNTYLAEMREKYGVAEGEETDAMTEEEIAHLQSLTGKEIAFEDYKERRRNELYNRRMALEAQLAYVSVKNSEAPAGIAATRLVHILQGNDAEVLFTAYPSLRDIEVQFVTDIRDGAFAAYATKGGYKRIELNAKKTPVDMIAPYILHEVQHAIQDIEGFAGGGNLSSLQSDENVTAKEAYDYYRKIAGEVEARNVSARINMTPEERIATLLSETEDVAREDQIFLREGAEIAMVGPKFLLSEETTQIFDAVKAKFGTTYDMREAGYILPDGSMLDFSGRHQVEGDASFLNGDRTVDHREISDIAYDADGNETGINTDLGDFLDRGAIRIDSNAGAINLNVAPTKAQKDRLKRLIERNDGYVYIDFGKGWDTEHYAEYEAARASRVLGDIDRYFDEGIKPTGNVKFSLQETNDRFNAELDAFKAGQNISELHLGVPSPLLRACGVSASEIFITAKTLRDHLKKHNLTEDEIKNLPIAINDPIMVYEWGEKAKSKIIITQIPRGEQRITVAIKMERGGKRLSVNELASVHGKDVERLMNEMLTTKSDFGKDNLKYVNKEIAMQWLGIAPPEGAASLTDAQQSIANIIQNFQNPKIEARNSLISPEMDASYLDAVENGDMETAQRMVMEAAKKAGYTEEVYHGTSAFGFQIFRSHRPSGAIFTSSRANVAANYGGDAHYASVRAINKGYKEPASSEDTIQNAQSVLGQEYHIATEAEREKVIKTTETEAKRVVQKMEALKENAGELPSDIADNIAWIENIIYSGATSRENGNEGDELYQMLRDDYERFVENKDILKDHDSSNLTKEQKEYINYLKGYEVGDVAIDIANSYANAVSSQELASIGGVLITIDRLNETIEGLKEIGTYHLMGDLGTNPLIIDAEDKAWYALEFNGMHDTDAVVEWAKENGYTSVVFKNIYDYGDKSDVKVFYSSNQLKSADTVTYDDNGNVIPLSERFNPEKEDIRYSLQSVEPFATYAKNMARALNIAQPIIVADTTEQFVRLMHDAGSKNPERARAARGVYRPSDDVIFINAEKFEKREDMFECILHEWTHAYTQRNIDKLKAILATLDEERVKAAGAELLPDFYKNESPLTILNEIISNFVGGTPKPLLLAIMRGQMDIAVFVSEAMSVIKGNEYADIFEAVMPVVKENLTNQKERYNGKREEPIVIARWMVADTAQENERPQQYPYSGRQRGGDEQTQYHTGNDRGGAREDAQEVGYRHSIEEIIDTPSDEEYKQQMLELAQQMERDAEERNLDKAQEIADVTGWVHLDDGTWQYYGNVDITEDAKESTRVRRWLESKAAVKKARTRKMYDDLLKEQKKMTKDLESESKARRSNASYAKAVDAILQGQAHEALPIEDQILVDVALGQKLRWEDEQGGSRRGLKTELGLRSTTAEGMTEVTGGNTYIEDYVAAVVERNNGYENGIDDNDVRNAVIEVFGSYPSRKATLAELSSRYPDTALNEATEAIAQLEQERDEALAQIDADLRSELADVEANPSQYERAYEEEGTWNLQFDIYTGALRKARNEVSRMERDMQKAKLTQREKTAAMRTVKRAVVDMLKGDLGRYTRKRDIQALMDAVNEAQTLYAMQRAIDKAMLAINELRLRKETARMNNLLKMRISSHDSAIDPRIFFENMMKGSKNVDSAVRRLMNDYWRGVNSSGVDVAKGVDGDTARVLQFIRKHSNLTAELGKAPTEGDILKRCEAWRKELRGEAVETSIFSDAERKEIEALSPEVRERMADAVSVVEGYLMVQYQLQNMDEGVTNARQEIEAEKAQIKKLNKEIKALQEQKVAVTDGRIVDAKKEIEERKKKVEQINRDIASVRIMNAGVYIGVMPDILDAFSHLNAQVESLLMGGRVDLADFRAKREAHKRELVSMVLEALDNPEALDRNKPKPTGWQKVKDTGFIRFFANHLGSLDNMLRSIDRNAPNGEGMVHTYFTTKLADAKDAIYENSVKAVDILDSKAQTLFGTTFGRAMRKAERKVLGTMTMTHTKEDGTKITEEYEMTVATALYTMMMWNQPASRPALENMGATEEDIEQLRTWLNANNPAWLQFAGWVVNDFLPSNRARYNEVYRAMNGTDMDFAENYFPIRRMSTAIPKEVDLADPSFENKPSTVTGAIMKRTENKLPIDLETSFFGALQDNIVEMEEWSALAPIISDFNAILSSPAVKKAMGDMGEYFHNDFQQAAKVATLNYAGDTKKLDGVFWQMVYRTWASTKLAFKAFTALKQLASSVLFLPYSGDPKFIGRLLHYYLGGKGKLSDAVYEKLGDGSLTNREEGQAWLNINWALENSSMFRRRWESGVAGNDIFTRELKYDSRTKAGRFMRSISEAVDWLQKKGMAPIALIDAYTVSAGMRAIYEYELANLTQKEGYTKEEAKKIAMRRAEMIANKSQQSSEGEYLAPLQMERGWMTSLTMFQNAPFAQGRNIAEAWKEITLKPDKEYAFIKKQEIARMKKARAAEYEAIEATIAMEKELGIITTEEQENLRREKLQRPINAEIEAQAHTATKKKMFRAKMRAYRTLAYNAFRGQFVFNLMGKIPYLLCGDDEEEKKKAWIELAWLTAFAPVSTITAGGTLMSILGGHKVSFSGALSEFEEEWNKIISEYKNDGFFEAMLAAGDFLIRKGFGVDYETFMRMYAGIENMFESGMSAENIFMALNAPDSQVRLLAGDRKEGETAQEYATRIMRLYSIFSNPEYSDYYNEQFSYRGENPAFLMSDYMARGMKKSWEMAYRSDVMRNKGLPEEWAAVLNTEKEYEKVVEALGFKANKTPADEAGYIDGEYRAPIEGLSEDDFYNLKYLARYAAEVAKYARTYLGGDENAYLEYVRDEMEAKRELISEYNKILNK